MSHNFNIPPPESQHLVCNLILKYLLKQTEFAGVDEASCQKFDFKDVVHIC